MLFTVFRTIFFNERWQGLRIAFWAFWVGTLCSGISMRLALNAFTHSVPLLLISCVVGVYFFVHELYTFSDARSALNGVTSVSVGPSQID